MSASLGYYSLDFDLLRHFQGILHFDTGEVIKLHIFSKDGVTVAFDFGGRFIDTFQLVKIDGAWKIASKFFVDQ